MIHSYEGNVFFQLVEDLNDISYMAVYTLCDL